MLRSRSSGLLPITHSGNGFPRMDSRNGLGLFNVRRRTGSGAALQRLLTYLVLTVLLGGSIYGVARVGRGSSGAMGAAGIDEFALSDALLDNARVSSRSGARLGGGAAAAAAVGGGASVASRTQQQQQQQQQTTHGGGHARGHGHAHHHMHEDVHDRRAALEQHAEAAALAARQQQQQQDQHVLAAAAAAADTAADLTQEQLEQQHIQQLQHLEQQHALAAQHALDEQQQGQAGGEEHAHRDPALAAHVAAHIAAQQALPRREGPSLYSANLSAVDIRGNIVHTADLMGKVTLVVNVASECGYTEANYAGLHRLYERYKAYGLEVIAFPCNQFGGQEPGSHAEIEAFVAHRYHATFTLMSKVEVNGPSAHPIFTWLKLNSPPLPGHHAGDPIGWNFEKFLLDKYGHPVKRYPSEMDYHDLELDVYNELIRF